MDLKIAVLPGDGIGPEIIEQAIKAIDATCKKYGHTVGYTYGSVGATAIDKTGNPYPEETHRICMQSDAVLRSGIPVSTTIPKPKSVRNKDCWKCAKN